MWDSFAASWHRLHEEGLIDADELNAISFPSYYRSIEEVRQGAEAVAGIKVVSVDEKVRQSEGWKAGAKRHQQTVHQHN